MKNIEIILRRKLKGGIYKWPLALCFLFLVSCNKPNTTTTEPPTEEHAAEKDVVELSLTQIKVANVVLGGFENKNLSEVITANGYTKLPPQSQADVSVFMGGVIKTVAVMEGQFVKKGQTLATFQSLEFNNVRLQKAKLTEELQQAVVNKAFLALEFSRQKELSDENVGTKKTFQKTSSDLEMVKSKIQNTENQIKLLEQNLAMSGTGNANNLAILATISGFVTAVNVKIGSSIKPDNVLFSIVNNAQMHADLLIYEKDLFKISVGQAVRFVLTNQGNQEINGKIYSIDKSFQKDSKVVAAHVSITNPNLGLIAGMYVNGLIDVGSQTAKALPLEAIAKAEGKEFIFIEEAHNRQVKQQPEKGQEVDTGVHFKRIEVRTGTAALGFVQVLPLQELPTGAKIAVKGAYYLQSAMSNGEGGGHDH